MNKPDDVLKKLRDDPMYRSILSSARTEAERRMISSTTESFVKDLMSTLLPGLVTVLNEQEKERAPEDGKTPEEVVIVESKG